MLCVTLHPENDQKFSCIVKASLQEEEMTKALRFAHLYNFKFDIKEIDQAA